MTAPQPASPKSPLRPPLPRRRRIQSATAHAIDQGGPPPRPGTARRNRRLTIRAYRRRSGVRGPASKTRSRPSAPREEFSRSCPIPSAPPPSASPSSPPSASAPAATTRTSPTPPRSEPAPWARQRRGFRRQNVGDRVFFEIGFLRPDAESRRRSTARSPGCSARSDNGPFTVEGDADERGTREYDLALGARRAAATKGLSGRPWHPEGSRIRTIELRQGTPRRRLQRHFVLVAEPPGGDRPRPRRRGVTASRPSKGTRVGLRAPSPSAGAGRAGSGQPAERTAPQFCR